MVEKAHPRAVVEVKCDDPEVYEQAREDLLDKGYWVKGRPGDICACESRVKCPPNRAVRVEEHEFSLDGVLLDDSQPRRRG
jgi:hypothetical protein